MSKLTTKTIEVLLRILDLQKAPTLVEALPGGETASPNVFAGNLNQLDMCELSVGEAVS